MTVSYLILVLVAVTLAGVLILVLLMRRSALRKGRRHGQPHSPAAGEDVTRNSETVDEVTDLDEL